MHKVIAALAAAACACGQLHDPSGCPKPCPPSCAASCLPTGFCSEARWQPSPSAPLVFEYGSTLDISLGDLPPGAALTVSLHAVFDLAARGDTIPWDYWIELVDERGSGAISVSAFNAVDFPVVADWLERATADASGVIDLRLLFRDCQDRRGRFKQGCLLLPGSSLVARVVDTSPWLRTPSCQ